MISPPRHAMEARLGVPLAPRGFASSLSAVEVPVSDDWRRPIRCLTPRATQASRQRR